VSDFQIAHLGRYLYRDGFSPASANYIPGAVVIEPNKTLNKKILLWFKKYAEGKIGGNARHERILEWKRAVEACKEEIAEDLAAKFETTEGAFAVVCERDPSLKYPGDFDEFRKVFLDHFERGISQTVRPNATCAICNVAGKLVYGQALSQHFKFYTLDKPGYIAGGFHQDHAAKNAPVCLDCFLKIGEGINLITNDLVRTLGGQEYWLIPKFHSQIDESNAQDVLSLLEEIKTQRDGKPVDTINFQALNRWETIQSEIPEALAKDEFPVSYDFFFFKKQTGKPIPHEIKLLIEDVSPTRLHAIRESAKAARLHLVQGQHIDFGFGILVDLTQDTFVNQDKDRAFLKTVENVFRGIPLPPSQVFSWIMRYLRDQIYEARKHEAKKERKKAENRYKELRYATRRAAVLIKFLSIHGVMNRPKVKEGEVVTEDAERTEAYFAKNPQVYPSAVHKALFMLGVLTSRLLWVQREVIGNDAFWSVLKDLKMKERDFVALLPRIQGKLRQYDAPFRAQRGHSASSPRRVTLAADYLQASPRPWNLSTDEMNYYFTLGLNLAFDFNRFLFPNDEETKKEEREADDATA
jgi:CRISPR-associated protein Csh1